MKIILPFRFATVFVCGLLSVSGLLLPFELLDQAARRYNYAAKNGWSLPWLHSQDLYAVSSVMLLSWLAFFIMSIGWVQGHQVHRIWPILGTLACVASILIHLCVPGLLYLLSFTVLFNFTASILAMFLVRFHLKQ